MKPWHIKLFGEGEEDKEAEIAIMVFMKTYNNTFINLDYFYYFAVFQYYIRIIIYL